MTEVVIGDEKIVTDLPAEKVADLQAPIEPEKPAEPAKEPEAPQAPAVEPTTEEPKTEPEKEPAKEPDVLPERNKKATPFQTLLEKKHEAEQRAEAAEKKLQELSEQPVTAATTADIKAFAEKYGLEEAFANDLVAAVRAGTKPELPKEVQELIAKQQAQDQAQAEQQAFNADYSRLQGTLKDDVLKDPNVREKIQALAYSTEKAPDGEPYFKKPLFELYMTYVKPEVEPGKRSAETSRGGSKATGTVMDFQAIFDRDDPAEVEAMDDKTFRAYNKWMTERQGDVPIRHKQ